MAETWRATAQAVAYAASKDMLDVFNGAASSQNIRVYRIYAFNNAVAAITGVLFYLELRRISTATGGTPVTPVQHSTANAALNVNTTAGHSRTITQGVLFRRILYQNDEPAVTTLDMDAMLTLVPYAEIWNAGYGDTNVEPILCRSGQAEGVAMVTVAGGPTTGALDNEIEFTNGAS